MINNEMKQVSLLTFGNTIDSYGQVRKGTPSSSDIEMMVKIYTQSSVDDPRYENVELIGLTKASVNTSNMIEMDSVKYDVIQVTPTRRYNEVLLRRSK